MKIRFLLYLLLVTINISFGQQNLLVRADDNINFQDFVKADKLISKYISKEGPSLSTNLLQLKIFFYRSKTIKELEDCEIRLHSILEKLNISLEDDFDQTTYEIYMNKTSVGPANKNEYTNLYNKDIGLEPDFLFQFYQLIQNKISTYYLKSTDYKEISYYVESYRYALDNYKDTLIQRRDSIEYERLLINPRINTIELFLSNRPKSEFKTKAQELLELTCYRNALSKNDTTLYRSFLKQFPSSNYYQEIFNILETIEYNNLSNSSIKENLDQFLSKYPNSKYKQDVQKLINELINKEFELTMTSNSIDELKLFMTNHPNYYNNALIQSKIYDLKSLILPFLGADRKYRLFDVVEQRFVTMTAYDEVSFLQNGNLLLKKDSLFTVIDLHGKIIIPMEYTCIVNTHLNQYIATKNGKKIILNSNGMMMLGRSFEYISDLFQTNHYIFGEIKNKKLLLGVIDTLGQVLIKPAYESIYQHTINNEELFFCYSNESTQLLNQFGFFLGEFQFLSLQPNTALLCFEKNGNFGIIDSEGKVMIEPKWKTIEANDQNEFIVSNEKGEFSIINLTNGINFPFQKVQSIQHINNSLYAINVSSDPTVYINMIYNSKTREFLTGKNSLGRIQKHSNNLWSAELGSSLLFFDENWRKLNELKNFFSHEDLNKIEDTEYYNEPYHSDVYFGHYDENGDYENFFDQSCSNLLEAKNLYGLDFGDHIRSQSIFPVYINGKFGFLDSLGQLRVPFNYCSADNFINGLSNVSNCEPDFKNHIIDEKGTIVLSDFTIVGWNKIEPDLFLVRNYSRSTLAWYNKKTKINTPFEKYLSEVKEYDRFQEYTYKDVRYFCTKDGEKLIDSGISFNNFEINTLLAQLQKLRSNRSEDYNEYQLNTEIIKLFEKCIELNPENPTTYYQYADFYLQQNDFTNALNKINQGLNSKFDISLLLKRSEINEKKSDYLNSAIDYRLIAEYYENSKSIKETIAYYYFKSGYLFTNSSNYQEGINSFDKGIKFNNKDANSYNNRGVCYEKLGKLELALKDFNMSISLGINDPNLALFIRNSGILLNKLNRKREGCEQLKKAANLDSKYLYDYNSYCNSNYRSGK